MAGVCEGDCSPVTDKKQSEITSKVIMYHLLKSPLSSGYSATWEPDVLLVSLWEGIADANKHLPRDLAIPLHISPRKVKSFIHAETCS